MKNMLVYFCYYVLSGTGLVTLLINMYPMLDDCGIRTHRALVSNKYLERRRLQSHFD